MSSRLTVVSPTLIPSRGKKMFWAAVHIWALKMLSPCASAMPTGGRATADSSTTALQPAVSVKT